MPRSHRRATNITLDADLVAEARALNVNISRVAETGLTEAIRKEKERRWQEENAEAIESFNRYVEEHGLPLEKYRPW
jgi:antitoxin CcdA